MKKIILSLIKTFLSTRINFVILLTLLFIISTSFAYTTRNTVQNLSIYVDYGAYSLSDSSQNISLQSNTQAYILSSNSLNFTLAIFPQFFPEPSVPTTSVAPSAGGGGPPSTILDFTVTPSLLKVLLRPGETIVQNLTVRNTGNSQLPNILIKYNLLRYITIADISFQLVPAEERVVDVVFTASLEDQPEVYTDIITVEAANIIKRVIAIVEIKKLRPLFDIEVKVDNQYKKVHPGQVVPADIILYNFGDLKPVDVNLFYSIRDLAGNDLSFADKTIAVNEQQLVKVNLTVPDGLEAGNYLIYGKIIYGENTEASSSDLIEVTTPIAPVKRSQYFIITIVASSIFLLIILILSYILYRKSRAREYELLLRRQIESRFRQEIESRLSQGYTKKQILKSAKRARWPKQIVKKILDELQEKN